MTKVVVVEMLPTRSINTSFIIIAKPDQSVDIVIKSLASLILKNNLDVDVQVVRGFCPSLQRNLAVEKSKNTNVIFLDNDSALCEDYFVYLMDALRFMPDALAVGGISEVDYNSQFQKSIKYVFASVFGIGPLRARYLSLGKLRVSNEKELILCNLMINRSAFLALGGFRIDLYPNEENEFLSRLSKLCPLVHHPLLRVKRPARSSQVAFMKQMINYGRGRGEHFLLNPNIFDLIYFIPLIFLLYLLTLPWHLFFLPLYFYIGLIFLASFFNFISVRDKALSFRLPLTFLYCHHFYGLGLFIGLFKGKTLPDTRIYSHEHFQSLEELSSYVYNRCNF